MSRAFAAFRTAGTRLETGLFVVDGRDPARRRALADALAFTPEEQAQRRLAAQALGERAAVYARCAEDPDLLERLTVRALRGAGPLQGRLKSPKRPCG